MIEHPELYAIAKKITLDSGYPYMDPRTLKTTQPRKKKTMDNILTSDENQAIQRAVRESLKLYRGYVSLTPETPQMKAKQLARRKAIPLLENGNRKLWSMCYNPSNPR